MKFATRRYRSTALLIAAGAMLWLAAAVNSAALRDTARDSGWVLLAMVLLLAAYNVRKKLPFLPLGSSAGWLQLHIYVGLLTGLVFCIHIAWRVPQGVFETTLALLYLSVFISGIVGLTISRGFARRLTTRGEDVMFERIPLRRRILQTEIEEIVLKRLSATESAAIARFYVERLQPFLAGNRNFWQHLRHSSRPRHRLLSEIRDYDRFLDDGEREAMREIATRVEAKDDLDYQFALQATLKCWLFTHVPLTYALLVFAVFHVFVVYAFQGAPA